MSVKVSTARAELDFKLLEMTMKEKRERKEEEVLRMDRGSKQARKALASSTSNGLKSRRKGRLGSFGPPFVSIDAHP